MEAAQYTDQSLRVVYRHLSADAQRIFKEMLNKEVDEDYINLNWVRLSEPMLKELWDTPEEDYWDELYAKQHQNG